MGKLFFGCLTGLCLCASVCSAEIQNQTTIAPILKKAMPTVVNIINQGELTITTNPFLKKELLKEKFYKELDNRDFVSIGSGVIIDSEKGLIVTNAHVVNLDKKITVTLNDGRQFQAVKLGKDDATDVALIKITGNHLTSLPIGNSEKLNVGDFVATIGSPFGLSQTVTSGIVSALHRTQIGLEGVENFIQTDAPINVGNSGGALIDMQGNLVGINTALLSDNGGSVGIGFAIPSNMVKSIVDQLLKYGKVERGIIGVLVQDMTPDLAEVFHSSAESKGALISQIIPGSPANKAGLKSGDIICKIGENSIESSGELRYLTGLLKIGETTDLTYLRYGKSYTIRISAAKLDAEKQMVTPYHKIDGIVMVDISELSPAYGYIQGIKVVNVDVYSQAIIAGLLPGDIIVSANNREMRSIKDLVEVVSNIGNRPLVLKVLRSASSMFVVIK